MNRKLAASCFVGTTLVTAQLSLAQTIYYDLTPSAGGVVNGPGGSILFPTVSGNSGTSTGSGTFTSLLAVSDNTGIAEGVSTSASGAGDLMADVDASKTDSLAVSGTPPYTLPTVYTSGTTGYIGVFIDINEGGAANSQVSLDSLTIYYSTTGGASPSAGSLSSFISNTTPSVVWSLDDLAGDKITPTVDRSLLLDQGITGSGSGRGDLYVLIPESAFPNPASGHFYFYAKYGEAGTQTVSTGTFDFKEDGGFEELGFIGGGLQFTALPTGTISAVPESSSGTCMAFGLAGLALRQWRRQTRKG